MRIGRQTERLPHVHDRQPNARTLPLAEPSVKLAHARLRAVLAAEPDRPTANKVTDHDPVAVAFADRNLVNPDHLRTRRAHALELSFHVLLVQRLDRVPVQRQFLRHVLDRRPSAPPPDKVGKALGIERIVREKLEPFSLHTATPATIDPPYLPVVPAHLDMTAAPAARFFERRLSVITRAFGSPKMPCTVGCGRNPGNQYVSQSRRLRFAVRAIHY